MHCVATVGPIEKRKTKLIKKLSRRQKLSEEVRRDWLTLRTFMDVIGLNPYDVT